MKKKNNSRLFFEEKLHQLQRHGCHMVAPWGPLPDSQGNNHLLLLHLPLF